MRDLLSYLWIKAVFSILILIVVKQAVSQNYTCVNENRVLTYSTPLYERTDDLLFLKAERVSFVGSDLVITFEKHFREVPDCFECSEDCLSSSFFGNTMIKKSNGVNIFFNERGDSIFINTAAELDDSFKLVKITDTTWIQAKLVHVSEGVVLGEPDSLKTFILKATNAQQQTTTHWLNGDSIVLSKNHGLITVFDLYPFPNYYANYRKPYSLVGQTNPELGVQNLDAFDIFDFEIGDEFHLEGDDNYTVFTKIRRKVIDKIVLQGAITYKIDYLRVVQNPFNVNVNKDTLELNVSQSSMSKFWTLPDGSARSSMFNENGNLTKYLTNYYDSGDSCMGVDAEDCWAQSEKYEPGLGLTRIDHVQSWACRETGPYLVYYKKGSTTWGTPLNFNVGIEDQKTNLPVKIISQPFSNSTTLIFNYPSPQNINIRVFNQLGQLISNDQIQIDKGTYQISKLHQHGVYFISISNEKQSRSFKIVR